jgi:hypothetical protein
MLSENITAARANGIRSYVIILISLASLLIIILSYLTFVTVNLSSQVRSVEQLNANLITNLERHTRDQLSLLIDELQDSLNVIALNKFDHALEIISDNLDDSANATIELANSKIIRNDRYAADSYRRAKEYLRNSEYEIGRIYLINAINHSPSKITYINELVSAFKAYHINDFRVLREVKSILELSLFQLEPSSIDLAINYLTEIDSLEHILLSSTNVLTFNDVDWQVEFNRLGETSINSICLDVNLLGERLDNLQLILSNLQDTESTNTELLDSIATEIELVNNVYNMSVITEKIDAYLSLLDEETDYSSRSASALILAASSGMTLFWENDLSQLPPDLTQLIQNEFPQKIDHFEGEILKAKSLPYFNEAKDILAEIPVDDSSNFQDLIEINQKAIELAAELTPKIRFEEFQHAIRQDFRQKQEKINMYQRQQYIAYQTWAAGVCSEVFSSIEKETIFIDDDAIYILEHSEIANIDLRIASPEVSQAYNLVFQKVVGELPADLAYMGHKKVMTSVKKALEDF